jgi:hypothetical protein
MLTEVAEVVTASTIRAIKVEAVSTSETSVNFYETTRRNILEDCHVKQMCLTNAQPEQNIWDGCLTTQLQMVGNFR